jgi:ankyrin repeat protein
MHERIDQIFTRAWQNVSQTTQFLYPKIKAASTLEMKTVLHHALVTEIKKLRLSALEDEHHFTFRAWVIDKFHDDPLLLHKNLHRLNFIKYDFNRFQTGELSLLGHICTKPKALKILEWVFLDLPQRLYQAFPSIPPYAESGLSDKVFSYLIENHSHYCPPFSPLFWAIHFKNDALLERILSLKPEWINVRNDKGYTPIMMAVYNQNLHAISKLLPLNPNRAARNFKQETLAHILFKSKDEAWVSSVIGSPLFVELDILEMLLRPEFKDHQGITPICQALYSGYVGLVKDLLPLSKDLIPALYDCYEKAIKSHHMEFLNILHNTLGIKLCDNVQHYISSALLAFKYYHADVIEWIRRLEGVPDACTQVFELIDLIYHEKWPEFIERFSLIEVSWEAIPSEFCFQITISLLEKQRADLIIHFNLFELSPHFHQFDCSVRKEKISFVHYLKSKTTPLSQEFKQYFLAYLEKNTPLYPNGIFDYVPEHSDVTTIFNLDKNILALKSPLLHRLENHLSQKSPEKYLEGLEAFISPEVDLNALDAAHSHLFTRIISLPNGLERIKTLKSHFPGFSLQNLDARASNLLHLATEQANIPAIRWACTQLEVIQERLSDSKTAFDIAFEMHHDEVLNVLRKQIKKSQFIGFLQSLMVKEKHQLIEFIFSHEKPFDWVLTPFHIQQLQTLEHPRIQAFLSPKAAERVHAPEPVAVVSLPKKTSLITIDHDILMTMIHSKNQKQFELLIGAEYQEILRPLFAKHFLVYLKAVFSSDCKPLNKHLIRIPVAQEKIQEQDTWNILMAEALQNRNTLLFENLLCRQSILESIKTKGYEHLQMALSTYPETFFDSLVPHVQLNASQLNDLLYFCIQSENPSALAVFLKTKAHRDLLIHAQQEWLLAIFSKDISVLTALMEYPSLNRYFIQQAKNLYLQALITHKDSVMDNIMALHDLSTQIRDDRFYFILTCQAEGLLDRLNAKWQSHPDLKKSILPFYHMLRLTLPEMLINAFRISRNAEHSLFLVGSTIHHLIEGSSFETLNDIDFVSNAPPPAISYKQSRVQPKLFFNSIFYSAEKQIKLEYFITSHPNQTFILEDYTSRDFTVNALYCNMDGHIYDPTGFGLADLREKVIRSVDDSPRESFAKDPIRILRAIRLITKGFRLLPEVEAAIIEWQPELSKINYGHLYAMTNAMFQSTYQQQVFALLLHYGLHIKLLRYGTPLFAELNWFVQQECSRYKSIK